MMVVLKDIFKKKKLILKTTTSDDNKSMDNYPAGTTLSAESDSDVMFCLQSY